VYEPRNTSARSSRTAGELYRASHVSHPQGALSDEHRYTEEAPGQNDAIPITKQGRDRMEATGGQSAPCVLPERRAPPQNQTPPPISKSPHSVFCEEVVTGESYQRKLQPSRKPPTQDGTPPMAEPESMFPLAKLERQRHYGPPQQLTTPSHRLLPVGFGLSASVSVPTTPCLEAPKRGSVLSAVAQLFTEIYPLEKHSVPSTPAELTAFVQTIVPPPLHVYRPAESDLAAVASTATADLTTASCSGEMPSAPHTTGAHLLQLGDAPFVQPNQNLSIVQPGFELPLRHQPTNSPAKDSSTAVRTEPSASQFGSALVPHLGEAPFVEPNLDLHRRIHLKAGQQLHSAARHSYDSGPVFTSDSTNTSKYPTVAIPMTDEDQKGNRPIGSSIHNCKQLGRYFKLCEDRPCEGHGSIPRDEEARGFVGQSQTVVGGLRWQEKPLWNPPNPAWWNKQPKTGLEHIRCACTTVIGCADQQQCLCNSTRLMCGELCDCPCPRFKKIIGDRQRNGMLHAPLIDRPDIPGIPSAGSWENNASNP
jgi:hypothetical protein